MLCYGSMPRSPSPEVRALLLDRAAAMLAQREVVTLRSLVAGTGVLDHGRLHLLRRDDGPVGRRPPGRLQSAGATAGLDNAPSGPGPPPCDARRRLRRERAREPEPLPRHVRRLVRSSRSRLRQRNPSSISWRQRRSPSRLDDSASRTIRPTSRSASGPAGMGSCRSPSPGCSLSRTSGVTRRQWRVRFSPMLAIRRTALIGRSDQPGVEPVRCGWRSPVRAAV